jgi:hypothetical protein
MKHGQCLSPRDVRAHFRIQVSTAPALACPGSASQTPSSFDGVFCVKGRTS